MKPIPTKLRKELSKDPYYKKCCLTGTDENIVWHHAWSYAHGQINEKWAIMPVCKEKHSPYGDEDSIHRCSKTEKVVKFLSLDRADIWDIQKRFPRADWVQIYGYLKFIYAKEKHNYPYLV